MSYRNTLNEDIKAVKWKIEVNRLLKNKNFEIVDGKIFINYKEIKQLADAFLKGWGFGDDINGDYGQALAYIKWGIVEKYKKAVEKFLKGKSFSTEYKGSDIGEYYIIEEDSDIEAPEVVVNNNSQVKKSGFFIGIRYHLDSEDGDSYFTASYGIDTQKIKKKLDSKKTPEYKEEYIFWELDIDVSKKLHQDILNDVFVFNYDTDFTVTDVLRLVIEQKDFTYLATPKCLNYNIVK